MPNIDKTNFHSCSNLGKKTLKVLKQVLNVCSIQFKTNRNTI